MMRRRRWSRVWARHLYVRLQCLMCVIQSHRRILVSLRATAQTCADLQQRGSRMGVAEHDFRDPTSNSTPASIDESRLVDALRHGDEAAFLTLVEGYQRALVRLALVCAS